MRVTAKRVVEIAMGEIGYHEKNTDAYLDQKTAPNDGAGNHTKYARDLHGAGFFNGDKCGYAWCAVFVMWVMWIATGKSRSEALRRTWTTGGLGAACRYAAGYFQAAGRYFQDPVFGDWVFFAARKGDYDHVELVTEVDGNYIYTVGGNSGNEVRRNVYSRWDSTIQGYGRPIYEEENMEEEIKKALENVLGKNVQTVEELPDWAREPVKKLMDRGILQGDGNDETPDLPGGGWSLRTIVMLFRVYDVLIGKIEGLEEKLRELGDNPQV